MGVAHRDGADGVGLAVGLQLVGGGALVCTEGNVGGLQNGRAHIHFYLLVFVDFEADDAVAGFHPDRVVAGKLFVAHKAGKAAGAVAALLHFTAFGVKDPVAKVHVRALRRLNHQQLIATDPKMAIGNFANVVGFEIEALGDQVDDDKVVPEPMHFGKSEKHIRHLCASPKARQRGDAGTAVRECLSREQLFTQHQVGE